MTASFFFDNLLTDNCFAKNDAGRQLKVTSTSISHNPGFRFET